MKTVTQFAFTGLAAVLFATGSTFAGESEVRAIDNHHGVITYVPVDRTQNTVTVGFYNGRTDRGIGRAKKETKLYRGSYRDVTTPHGTVSYYAPAE